MNVYRCMYVCVYLYMYICGCARVQECIYVYVCVRLRVAVIGTRLIRSRPITGDLDWCSLWTRYTGDLKTDLLDDPEICTVNVVKTRRRFESKIVSFHVSVCSYIYFFIYHCQYIYVICIISFDCLRYFTIMTTCITS